MEEIERLKKQNKHLKIENDKFKGKLEDTSSLMKEKVEQANKQSKQIKEVRTFSLIRSYFCKVLYKV